MRNTIITASLALLMGISGAAQTIVMSEGFFDTDPGVGSGIPLVNTPTGSAADISGSLPLGLSSGFHSFYVRCSASTKLWSNARGRTVYVNNSLNQPPVLLEIADCEYFIDVDPGVGNGVDVPVALSPTEVSIYTQVANSQSPGVHQLGIRFQAENGMWSNTKYRTFLVRTANDNQIAEEIIQAEYFFDVDPGVGNGGLISIDTPGLLVNLNSSMAINLTPGVHQLYIRCKSNIGHWSNAQSRTVLVNDGTLVTPIHYIDAAEYYIDADPGQGNGTPIAVLTATMVDINEFIDASAVAIGVHQLYIRVRSDQNVWSDFAAQTFTISSDTQPVFTLQALNPLCANTNTGTIEVTTVGGTPPFFYAWDGVVGNDTLFNASAGEHQLIVTDAISVVVLDTTITLVAPEALTFEMSSTNVSCLGGSDGTAAVIAAGGVGDYIYDWNGFDINQLVAGVYFFSVTDGNGCDVSGSVSISQPDAITTSAIITPVTFPGGCDGAVEITISGGTPPFDVVWNDPNASTGTIISDLCEGQYIASITDANGCLAESEIVDVLAGLEEIASVELNVIVSPNPGTGIFRVAIDAPSSGDIVWSVTDTRGRIVAQSPKVQSSGIQSQWVIDLTDMAQGLYHLQVGFNGTFSAHRLMLISNL
jgi:hypothetical protein